MNSNNDLFQSGAIVRKTITATEQVRLEFENEDTEDDHKEKVDFLILKSCIEEKHQKKFKKGIYITAKS